MDYLLLEEHIDDFLSFNWSIEMKLPIKCKPICKSFAHKHKGNGYKTSVITYEGYIILKIN